MEHGGKWLQLESPGGNLVLELNYYPRGNRFYEPYRRGSEMDHLGFFVDDVDGWLRRAVQAGAKREVEWKEGGWRISYVRDPDGIWLEFIGRTKAPPRRAIRLSSRRRRTRRVRQQRTKP
jgi:catechol 2,3-dioxygenase-like lactoylglutathione lyase family enzyme